MPIFYVNKERVDVGKAVPADMPLLWILRDSLNLTGTKYGCGMALCGACTVHIEGQPARACQTPLSSIKQGRSNRQATARAAAVAVRMSAVRG